MRKFIRISAAFLLAFVLLANNCWIQTGAEKVWAESGATSIYTENDLDLLRTAPGGSYRLEDDIVLTSDFVPIASFTGTLDGNGHTIRDLSMSASSSTPRVAFIINNLGTVKNLGFINASINGISSSSSNWAAIICAENNGTVENCYASGTVSGAYRSAGITVKNSGTVRNSYSVANVTAQYESGGVVAVNQSGAVVDRCYSAGDIYSVKYNTGGIAAYAYTGSTISNCAALNASVSNGQNQNPGRIVGRVNGTPTLTNNIASEALNLNGSTVTGSLTDKNGLNVATDLIVKQYPFEKTLSWDFDVWEFDGAKGRPVLRNLKERGTGSVYYIDSQSDLEEIRNHGSSAADSGNTFILTDNITLSGAFTPINDFYGTLDGSGYAIINLSIEAGANDTKTAFIINNRGTIKNLGMAAVAVHGNNTNENCHAAGLVCTNYGSIEKSYVSGNVSGGYRTGGIACHNKNVIDNCYALVYVTAYMECGGISAVSEANSITRKCGARAMAYSNKKNTGGISGYAYTGTVIENCMVLSGNISNGGNGNQGRIVGRLNGTPTLTGNFASENAFLQLEVVLTNNPANKNGATVTNGQTAVGDIYANLLGWDMNNIWSFDAALRRPVLANMNNLESDRVIYRINSENIITYNSDITCRQIRFTDVNWNEQSISVITADLSSGNYKVITGTNGNQIPPHDANGDYIRIEGEDGKDSFKASLVDQMLTTPGAIAGVNGEFCTAGGPEGYMIKDASTFAPNESPIINGVRISTPGGMQYPFHSFLGVKKNTGELMIGTYDDDWASNWQNLEQATGGQFIVVKNGAIPYYGDQIVATDTEPNYDQESFYRYKERHPRTVAGFTGNVITFVAIDGRQTDAVGMYIEELGPLMRYFGCNEAINMDGGGSTTAAVLNNSTGEYDVLNNPCSNAPTSTKPGGAFYQDKWLRKIYSTVLIVENND